MKINPDRGDALEAARAAEAEVMRKGQAMSEPTKEQREWAAKVVSDGTLAICQTSGGLTFWPKGHDAIMARTLAEALAARESATPEREGLRILPPQPRPPFGAGDPDIEKEQAMTEGVECGFLVRHGRRCNLPSGHQGRHVYSDTTGPCYYAPAQTHGYCAGTGENQIGVNQAQVAPSDTKAHGACPICHSPGPCQHTHHPKGAAFEFQGTFSTTPLDEKVREADEIPEHHKWPTVRNAKETETWKEAERIDAIRPRYERLQAIVKTLDASQQQVAAADEIPGAEGIREKLIDLRSAMDKFQRDEISETTFYNYFYEDIEAIERKLSIVPSGANVRECLADLMRWVRAHPKKATIHQSLLDRCESALAASQRKG